MNDRLPAVVEGYLEAVDRADRETAVGLALGLLDTGWSAADVLVDLVAAAQREIGLRWQTGRWSIAQEHAATHVSDLVVSAVASRTPVPTPRGHAVMACVEGEWHALAARIVAETVRAAGWRVTFLGASVPARHLVSYLHQTGPDMVLLSCVQPNRLVRAARMIEACRSAGVPVIAGGPGFGPEGRWATAVGATAWGATARDAARLLDRHRHPGFAAGPVRPAGSDEYVAVLRRRREVVERAVRAVAPPPEHAEELATAVAHLVDALAAAIRVGDPQLLVDFAGWQVELLSTRPGRTGLLDTVLAGCASVLAEHPTARDYVQHARAAVAETTA
ncbi:cobalamin B12-binding domain-containing protein [Micromonospora sp. SH-82]|uniref:cobalamin B12-binding domain-containing protein n=1 Tax=Micromonospora sp. SH-82 TaxID=3132938 RepID=UPI003EBF0880